MLQASLDHFLKGEYPRATFRVIQHKSGSVTTPTGQYQIVIPVIQESAEPIKVSIGGYMLGEFWIPWGDSVVFIHQDVLLLPERVINYYFILLY
jgi:hypothetical protein